MFTPPSGLLQSPRATSTYTTSGPPLELRGVWLKVCAWLNTLVGMGLLVGEGVSVVSVVCSLVAALCWVLIGLTDERAEMRAGSGQYGATASGSGSATARPDWTVVEGAYLNPRPNRRR